MLIFYLFGALTAVVADPYRVSEKSAALRLLQESADPGYDEYWYGGYYYVDYYYYDYDYYYYDDYYDNDYYYFDIYGVPEENEFEEGLYEYYELYNIYGYDESWDTLYFYDYEGSEYCELSADFDDDQNIVGFYIESYYGDDEFCSDWGYSQVTLDEEGDLYSFAGPEG
jgi:hypothetical protein